MALIVQKFGGSSVADAEKIKHVANRVLETQAAGHQVCVVVSAMGDTTDELIDLADSVSTRRQSREMDMLLTAGERISMSLLAMAIQEMGGKAKSFTGFQAGISTDNVHGSARIWKIEPTRIRETLDQGEIAIVAGFQGFSFESGDVTTLGRGGSDTTAVALAAALKADVCEIYSDVDGVYTADPRVVPRAHKLAQIDIDSMLELSSSGAKILYIRAVEFARRHQVPLRVRSTFSLDPGTLVYTTNPGDDMEEPVVSGVAADDTQSKITVIGIPDRPGKAAELFQIVAEAGANIDMIVQNVSTTETHLSDISFTLPHADRHRVVEALKTEQSEVGFKDVTYDDEIGKLSIVGAGMKTSSGVSAKLFGALARAGINIEMISTSEIRISVVTRADQLKEATRIVHSAFELDAADTAVVYAGTGR
ncbi:aspartate kinase [Aquiluna sp. KACHI24]|uniref:aspartate kinase n=1 Tax=Aquiluna sp. KACHI24 TaxID=2968831 RepID=UPI00220BD90E|nr:aspartate kinase [Aquiluna sp. KACHI24]BDQ00760.1 aspartokinase [Aquiluna sp. KACHI24]